MKGASVYLDQKNFTVGSQTYVPPCTVYSVRCAVFHVQYYALYNVHSNVYCTLYTVRCTCTLYGVAFVLIELFIIILFKLSYFNKYKSYLRVDEDFVTSKISPANFFTLLH